MTPESDDPDDVQGTRGETLILRLYVAGQAPNSTRALDNLQRLLDDGFDGELELEVVDVFDEPGRAADDNIIVTPTLIRRRPEPQVRIVGNLGDRRRVAGAVLGEAASRRDDPDRRKEDREDADGRDPERRDPDRADR